jgi:hypothetical protein
MVLNDKVLIGLIILSFCCSLVGLFFGRSNDFKVGLKIMIGGFFFGTVVAYVLHDNEWVAWVKRILVLLSSMFAKPLYDKIGNRIGYWLDRFIVTKITNVNTVNDQYPEKDEISNQKKTE